MRLFPKVHFTWDFSIGQLFQLGIVVVTLAGAYYTLNDKADDNADRLLLHELRMDRMEAKMRNDLENVERRIISSIDDMKSDVRWLVRSQTNRQWIEEHLDNGEAT